MSCSAAPRTYFISPSMKCWLLKSNLLSSPRRPCWCHRATIQRCVTHFHLHSKKPSCPDLICLVTSSIVSPDVSSSAEGAVTVKARRPGGSGPSERCASLSVLTFVSLCSVDLVGRSDVTRSGSSGETLLNKRSSHRKWRRDKKDRGEACQTRRGERL